MPLFEDCRGFAPEPLQIELLARLISSAARAMLLSLP